MLNTRGTYKFEIEANGNIIYNAENLEKLRTLFLDRSIINGELLGPGDPGDFDLGGWHILCHLTAGCAIFRKSNRTIWVEISHVPLIDKYSATVTVDGGTETVSTFPLLSEEGQNIMTNAKLIGFVEGSSYGHISAREVCDNAEKFNNNIRQEYDMIETSASEGGRVWEHWVATRNIRMQSSVGTSILNSYLAMLSICGGVFTTLVGKGRIDYHHPEQLKALAKSGLISYDDMSVDITPKPIPRKAELLIYTANPNKCVEAVKSFSWDEISISYFMFERKIDRWNTLNLNSN
jgi:hypothetical protein